MEVTLLYIYTLIWEQETDRLLKITETHRFQRAPTTTETAARGRAAVSAARIRGWRRTAGPVVRPASLSTN